MSPSPTSAPTPRPAPAAAARTGRKVHRAHRARVFTGAASVVAFVGITGCMAGSSSAGGPSHTGTDAAAATESTAATVKATTTTAKASTPTTQAVTSTRGS